MLNIIICILLAYSQANNPQQNPTQINNTNINQDLQIFETVVVAPNNNSLIIVENPYILITFYQQQCPYSQHFLKELKELKEEGDKLNITFGLYCLQKQKLNFFYQILIHIDRILYNPKILKGINKILNQQYDVGISEFHKYQAFNKYRVEETPTLIFFKDEVQHMFFGRKKSNIVLKWISEFFNGNTPPKEIFSEQEFNKLLEDNKDVLFYQRNSSINYEINYDKFYQFAIQNTNPKITLVYSSLYQKNEPFTLTYYKQKTQVIHFNYLFTIESIKKFVLKYSLPLIPQLNSESEELVFHANSLSFILFYNLDESSKSTESAFQEVAIYFNTSYQFSKINIQDEQYFQYLVELGVNDGIIPKIVALNGKLKYKYDGADFSVKGIKSFIFNVRQGQISSYTLSQPIPDYNHTNSYVKNIVGLNYDAEIKNNNKNILLKYHVTNCKSCIELEQIYEQLAYNYREDQNLLFAQIDIRLNDFTDVYYPRQTPDIILFLQKNGQREAIFWNYLEMTYDNIQMFVEYITVILKYLCYLLQLKYLNKSQTFEFIQAYQRNQKFLKLLITLQILIQKHRIGIKYKYYNIHQVEY